MLSYFERIPKTPKDPLLTKEEQLKLDVAWAVKENVYLDSLNIAYEYEFSFFVRYKVVLYLMSWKMISDYVRNLMSCETDVRNRVY